MTKDSYLEISSHFGIHPLEQSIALRGDKFVKKYSSSENYLCRLIADINSLSSWFFFFFFLFCCCCVLFINVLFCIFYATIKLVK